MELAARRQLGGPPQSEDLTEPLRAWEEVVEQRLRESRESRVSCEMLDSPGELQEVSATQRLEQMRLRMLGLQKGWAQGCRAPGSPITRANSSLRHSGETEPLSASEEGNTLLGSTKEERQRQKRGRGGEERRGTPPSLKLASIHLIEGGTEGGQDPGPSHALHPQPRELTAPSAPGTGKAG